jgi:hypothetical protein
MGIVNSGYVVTSCGCVIGKRNTVLKPMATGAKRKSGQRYKIRVSTAPRVDVDVAALVLETFVGPRPEGHVAMHLNDDPSDNRLENLKWGTRSENVRDSVSKGRYHKQKLSLQDKEDIRSYIRQGCRNKDVATFFGVSQQRVSDVLAGRCHG